MDVQLHSVLGTVRATERQPSLRELRGTRAQLIPCSGSIDLLRPVLSISYTLYTAVFGISDLDIANC